MVVDYSCITCLAEASVLDYFIDSNFAGKVVIFVLVVMNCYAISLMYAKYSQLKKAVVNNTRDE